MKQKGNNLVVHETRLQLMSVLNTSLKELPITVVELLIKDLLKDITNKAIDEIEKEQQDYQSSLQQDLTEEELA